MDNFTTKKNKSKIKIPHEICNLQNLQKIEVNKFHSNSIHKNKMIIFNWDNEKIITYGNCKRMYK